MAESSELASGIWAERIRIARQNVQKPHLVTEGKLTRMIGLTLEAKGCQARVGSRCVIESELSVVDAKVVGFSGDTLYLMPLDDTEGLSPGSRVVPSSGGFTAPVGDALLGRIIDSTGLPIDGQGPVLNSGQRNIMAEPVNPLHRSLITEPLDVGVRAINSLLTIGRGQRIGLIAGSGIGKSQLLGMMSRYTEADVTVIAMIGERGREVKAFIETVLGQDGLSKACVVAAAADNSAVRRTHGALLATSIAEHFRDQGKNVLLLMDSLTRFAQAQREIGLAIGEPPTTRGYPPSVFKTLPQLVERAGFSGTGGSITAVYTVLAEGDDQNDPVVDAARAVLDGHIVLSRRVAESGIYPAIDLEASISRLASEILDARHLNAIERIRQLYGVYRQNEDLISIGVYQSGSNPVVDQAITAWPTIQQFIRQGLSEPAPRDQCNDLLLRIADQFADSRLVA